ncbi:ANTAR domain-containing response regulator [Rhizobium skierniewicense]|uniref:ANTAR domain-containing response regulator n=1 Tax=Rhizobium skierniewicense TaxID=984260 RepID=UPI001574ABFF|nr:ANTAR domain-containing protein [Rhizobium skierniewicense]NTF33867.1 ANTAR domain-containing protein [Rhizobium skierniewicense]
MRSNRYVQNFRQRRALVLSNDMRAVDTITAMVTRLGMSLEQLSPGNDEFRLVLETAETQRDVLFLDGDLNLFPDTTHGGAEELRNIPVVGLVGIEAPSRLRTLMQLGATAFLSKPVHSGSIFSALYLAINTFEQKAGLRSSIQELENRRRYRRHVIKAVTLVMKSHSLDDEGAFAMLRRESMRARLSLEAYCESVVQRSTMKTTDETEPDKKQAVAE